MVEIMLEWIVPIALAVLALWVIGSIIYEAGYSKAYWERTAQIDRLLRRGEDP